MTRNDKCNTKISEQDDTMQKTTAWLDALEERLKVLKVRAKSEARVVRAEAHAKMEHLDKKIQEARLKLRDRKAESQDAWKALRDGLEKAWSEVRDAAEKARDAVRS